MIFPRSSIEKIFLICFALSVPGVMLGYAVLVGFALLSLCAVVMLLERSEIREALRPTPLALAWLVFLGLCALNIPGSLDILNSTRSIFSLALVLIFTALTTHYLVHSMVSLQILQMSIILATLSMIILALGHVYVFEGLLRVIHLSSETPASFDRVLLKKPASGFVLLMPMALYLLYTQTGAPRIIAALAVIGIVWLIVISESRSAMAAVLALISVMGLLAMVILNWRGGKIIAFLGLVAVILAAIFFYMQHIRGDWVAGALGIPGWIIDNPRQILWYEVLLLLQEDFPSSIFSGYGVNALEELERGVRELRLTADAVTSFTAITNHPHNWLLEIAAETGLIGLLSALVALSMVLYWSWRRRHYAPNEVIALFGVYAAFCSASLFNYSIWSVWWQIGFAIMNALYIAIIQVHVMVAEIEGRKRPD